MQFLFNPAMSISRILLQVFLAAANSARFRVALEWVRDRIPVVLLKCPAANHCMTSLQCPVGFLLE